MERWQNKIAVVTGASSGIGAAICKDLLSKGMIVVGLARRQERMENVFRKYLPKNYKVRFHAVRCDVSKESDIKSAFAWIEEHLGGVDVLVNNAGIVKYNQIVSPNNTYDLKSIVETNVIGVALCTREAFRSMKKRNVAGHVILINSTLGHSVPMMPGINLSIYPPTKHALTAMTEVLRQEFNAHNTKIKITSISPGAVDTEIFTDQHRLPPNYPILRAEDVSDAVLYCIQTPPNVQIHELILRAMP